MNLNRERKICALVLRTLAAKAPHVQLILDHLQELDADEKEYARSFIREELAALHARAVVLEQAAANDNLKIA